MPADLDHVGIAGDGPVPGSRGWGQGRYLGGVGLLEEGQETIDDGEDLDELTADLALIAAALYAAPSRDGTAWVGPTVSAAGSNKVSLAQPMTAAQLYALTAAL